MIRMDPGQLEALQAAVDQGTFDAAARLLNVTPSAISQRVKALEIAVGRVLLTRTKPVTPTSSGQVLLRLARQIDVVTADAALEIGLGGGSAEPTEISLGVNADSLATWLLPALATTSGTHIFDLRRDDQDRTADLLRRGEVMAAVTASGDVVPGCDIVPLGSMRYRATSSPAFAARWFGDGGTVAELGRAPVVVFDRDDLLQDAYLARRSRGRLDPPRHHVPDSTAFVEAIRLGLGWGMVPDQLYSASGPTTSAVVGSDPRRGLETFDPRRPVDVALFWQQWRLRSVALDQVAAAVRAAAATALRPPR